MLFKNRKKIILDRGPSWPDYKDAKPFMIRYYILFRKRPKWFPFNVFIHKILKNDLGDLHDHYWPYFTVILSGGYYETTKKGTFFRKPGYMGLRKADDRHSLKLIKGKPAWTLIFVGPNKGSKSHAKYDPNSQKGQY